MQPDDRDSPWKEALDRDLEPFMRSTMPYVTSNQRMAREDGRSSET